MPATQVNVSYSSGSPAADARVSLSFHTGGVTDTVRTNGNGVAVIQHSSSGTAKIFVDGVHKDTQRCPGNYSYTK